MHIIKRHYCKKQEPVLRSQQVVQHEQDMAGLKGGAQSAVTNSNDPVPTKAQISSGTEPVNCVRWAHISSTKKNRKKGKHKSVEYTRRKKKRSTGTERNGTYEDW